MSTPTVLAVDGNSLLHRTFHAQARSMYRTPDGVQGWAVRGLLSQLSVAVDRVCADVVVVGFDDRGNSSRKRRWPTYKAQRAPKPESLERQLDLAVEVLRDLGVVVVVPEGLEADDVLASVAAQAPALRRADGRGHLRPRQLRAHRRAHPDAADPQRRRRRLPAARPRAAGDGDRRAPRAVPRPRRPARRLLRQPARRARASAPRPRSGCSRRSTRRRGRLRRRRRRRRALHGGDRQGPHPRPRRRPRPASGGCSTAR